ncbi:hypothetical protein B0H34DRAFT_795489 [Crassisporium funariophilum]|nr:hypothetical protein B0H34DRAFT_795489 [Crassisporium funariophilum]
MALRRLSLHTSALSDVEYEIYTASLRDLAIADDDAHNPTATGAKNDDVFYEDIVINVREARAWLRGRYSHVPTSTIDKILRLLSPNLSLGDTVTGSEFFAVLRLLVHAENGKEVERSLAFAQAQPRTTSGHRPSTDHPPNNDVPSISPSSRSSSPAKRRPEAPSHRPYAEAPIATSSSPPNSFSHNPFSATDTSPRSTNSHPQPPLHPSQRSESSRSLFSLHSSHNPFAASMAPLSDDGSKIPPLPPRKPPPSIPSSHTKPPVPVSRHESIRNRLDRSRSPTKFFSTLPVIISTSSTYTHVPPVLAPKPPHHVTSTLMKQSLQASKAAQTMKKAEAQLEKERVMQVLKSSSVVSGAYSLAGASVSSSSIVIGTNIHNQHQHPGMPGHPSTKSQMPMPPPHMPGGGGGYAASASASSGSDERGAPPLPRRRGQQQPSPPLSTSSLEQVALAAPPSSLYTSPSASRTMYARANTNPESSYMSPFRSPVGAVHPYTASPDRSPTRGSLDMSAARPPMHPDRKSHLGYQAPSTFTSEPQRSQNLEAFEAIYGPSSASASTPTDSFNSPTTADSPTARVFRSKSLHHPSPPLPPLPPPLRRKRPESVQMLSSPKGESSTGTNPLARHATISTPSNTHRRSSLSVSSTPSSNHSTHAAYESPMSNIQRTIATLQPKLDALQIQPRLDKARYKAEAGFSRRGFVRDVGRHKAGVEGEEEEGLFHGNGGDAGVDDAEEDDEWMRGRGRSWDREGGGAKDGDDNLKWPVGEGWKPL